MALSDADVQKQVMINWFLFWSDIQEIFSMFWNNLGFYGIEKDGKGMDVAIRVIFRWEYFYWLNLTHWWLYFFGISEVNIEFFIVNSRLNILLRVLHVMIRLMIKLAAFLAENLWFFDYNFLGHKMNDIYHVNTYLINETHYTMMGIVLSMYIRFKSSTN